MTGVPATQEGAPGRQISQTTKEEDETERQLKTESDLRPEQLIEYGRAGAESQPIDGSTGAVP